MGDHLSTVSWRRGDATFTDLRYGRAHEWRFDGGAVVPASASPHHVHGPYTDPSAVDPEEAFVAALSSCHMLSFLWVAARRGFVVDEYVDDAVGHMGPNAKGHDAITRVVLRPRIRFSGPSLPSDAEVERLHHEAHEICFLANSVTTTIDVESARTESGDFLATPPPPPGAPPPHP